MCITMKCNYCNYIHNYNNEAEFFQGEMWGLADDSVMCNQCLENEKHLTEKKGV